jgi:hypothetical protein
MAVDMFPKEQVKSRLTSRAQRTVIRHLAALLMFLLWVGTSLLAASPELHRFLHPDAQSPDHQCVVTQAREHAILYAAPMVAIPELPTVELTSSLREHVQLPSLATYRLSPSRAPPCFSNSVTVAG